MTGRGWWTLFCVLIVLAVGLLLSFPALTLVALTVLLWLLWEWLFFSIRLRSLLPNVSLERELRDERGPVMTLWAGRSFTVRVVLRLRGIGRVPFVAVSDPVPFGVVHEEGQTTADGELQAGAGLEIAYRVSCPAAGLARFEGLRVEVSDLHGLFAHVGFIRAPVVLRILPRVLVPKVGGALTKRDNQLPPPGLHRLRQPGSGSELLDLRDYQPGDPPRTIAWKVSARRDRLVTREYESEVPVRCTLFLDASSSVRVPSPPDLRDGPPRSGPANDRPLDQLVEIAAGAVRASVSMRDLTGLCVFDEQRARLTPIKRTARHVTELMQILGETAGLGPVAARADPELLAPLAYALAREVYPDLLRQEVNRTPGWLIWLAEDAVFSRHRRGWLDALYSRRRSLKLWSAFYVPFWVLVANVAGLFIDGLPDWVRGLLAGLLVFGVPLLFFASRAVGWLSLLLNAPQRRRARVRKQLAAIFSVRYGPGPGAMQLIMEDDDLYSLYLQRFLAEHQVPYAPPLYDERGNYLFASAQKVRVLAAALVEATARGRDNELFVLLADFLELDEAQLEPLLQAVRVALSRHHQVVVVCAWPRGVPAPRSGESPRPPQAVGGLIARLATDRVQVGFARLRRAFARLGVQVTSAGSDESVPLILDRMQRLRMAGGRR
jgi:uncharacterized protein (DUF58 family)